jgi:hypothetical protein
MEEALLQYEMPYYMENSLNFYRNTKQRSFSIT